MNDRQTLKLLGLDFELSNAIKGQGQVELAAKMLLQEIAGYPQRSVLGEHLHRIRPPVPGQHGRQRVHQFLPPGI